MIFDLKMNKCVDFLRILVWPANNLKSVDDLEAEEDSRGSSY